MILKELYISDDIRCPFHNGLNIILGSNRKQPTPDAKKLSDANGVGKTRIVKSIVHVLGGDTGGAFNSEYFSKKAYWASLHVEIDQKDYVFSRPLWAPFSDQVLLVFSGTISQQTLNLKKKNTSLSKINNISDVNKYCGEDTLFQVLIKNEAKRFISRLEKIDYSEGNLSFSNALDYIARDEMLGFSDTVSRPARTEWVQHRCIQYLFGLPAVIEEQVADLKQQAVSLAQQEQAIKEYLKENGIKSIGTIQNKKTQLKKKLEKVQRNTESYKVKDSIETIRKKYADLRSELVDLNANLNTKESQKKSHTKNLDDIKIKENSLQNLLDTKSFYQEILEYFPEKIADNFDKYNKFFSSISEDRRKYYDELIQDLDFGIKIIKEKKSKLEKDLNETTKALTQTDIIGDLSSLAKEEEAIKTSIRELNNAENKLLEAEHLDSKREKIIGDRQELIKAGKELEKKSRKKREKLIELFQSLVTQIYSTEDAVLDFEYNDNSQSSTAGRTEVLCSIPSQQSKGRTHAKICIFDYVWFLRERTSNEYNPEFLIHDGPFSAISPEPKKRMLLRMSDESKRRNKQYIITANDVELPDWKELKQFVCIELDGSKASGKFFGEQYE